MNQDISLDIHTFNNLKISMGEIFETIIEVFFEDSLSAIVQMGQQINNNDIKGARITAHTLKSSAQTLGAYSLSNLCAEIESLSKEQKEKVAMLYKSLLVEYEKSITSIKDILDSSNSK